MNRLSLCLLAALLVGSVACERHSASELADHGDTTHHGDSHSPTAGEHVAAPAEGQPAHHGDAAPAGGPQGSAAPATHAPEGGDKKVPHAEAAVPPGGPSSDPHTVPAESKQFFPKTQ